MRIAIATDGNDVAAHFGRCPEYTLVDLEGNRVRSKVVVANPGHQPGYLPAYLHQLGVECVIAGGMGPRAQQMFADRGIDTVVGVTGTVEEVLARWLKGDLSGGPSLCHHRGEGASCPSRCPE